MTSKNSRSRRVVMAGLIAAPVAGGISSRAIAVDGECALPFTPNMPIVNSIAALRCAPRKARAIYLMDGDVDASRSGVFVWDSTISAKLHQIDAIDADGVGQGIFVAPRADKDGAWRRVHDGAIDPRWYGLEKGTGKLPEVWEKNRRAIQRAIDLIQLGAAQAYVSIPAGDYEFSGTIHQGYGVSYTTIVVKGAGRRYGSVPGSGTILWHRGSTHYQAWNMQGQRAPRLSHLSIRGSLYDAIFQTLFSPADKRLHEESYNVAPDRSDGGDGRYNPYAGVTIDAFAGDRPQASYPDVAYDRSLGAVPQYGKLFSSQMTLDDVDISGFIAGVCVQPCNADGNGDYLLLERCAVNYNKFAISVGNGQSRIVGARNSLFNGAFCALTNSRHGRQIGQFGGEFSTCEIGISVWLGEINLSFSTNLKFTGCKSESVWACFKTTGIGGSISFEACDLNFNWQLDPGLGVPPHMITGDGANVEFNRCSLRYATIFSSEARLLRFVGYGLLLAYSNMKPIGPWSIPSHQAFPAGVLAGGASNAPQEIRYRAHKLSPDRTKGVDAGWRSTDGADGFTLGRNDLLPYFQQHSQPRQTDYGPGQKTIVRPRWSKLLPKKRTDFELMERRLILTLPREIDDSLAMFDGFCPGDLLRCRETGTVFVCKSRVGAVLEYQQESNFRNSGGGCIEEIPNDGVWEFINCRVYQFCDGYVSVAAQAGSPHLRIDGGAFPSELAPADALLLCFESRAWLAQKPESIVASVDRENGLITMRGGARETVSGVITGFAISAPPPNS